MAKTKLLDIEEKVANKPRKVPPQDKRTKPLIVDENYNKDRKTKAEVTSIPNLGGQIVDFVSSADLVLQVTDKLIEPYAKGLDELIDEIDKIVGNLNKPISDTKLEYFVLNLPIVLYFAVEGIELLGVQDDVSKAVREEKYNYAYQSVQGTIPDKQAFASLEVQETTLMNTVYQRSYKKLKRKVDAAMELLASLKKIMNKREVERGIH